MSSYALLRLNSVQNWLSAKVAAYLSGKLKTKVEVRGVDVALFRRIVLEGLYIQDLHRDTLIYADRFYLQVDDYDLKLHTIDVGAVRIDKGKFYLHNYFKEPDFNLQFLIDAFSSQDTSSPGPQWLLKTKSVQLSEVSFALIDDNEPFSEGMDYFHLKATHINLDISDISIKGDTISGNIHHLSCKEKSGFNLEKLSGKTSICGRFLRIDDLHIKTPYTNVETDLLFTYQQYEDWLDFNNKILMESEFDKSKVSFTDIAYFAPALDGLNPTAYLDGEVKGTVSHLKGKNIAIAYGRDSYLKGTFTISGLPNIDETLIDFKFDDLQTTKYDIEQLKAYPFNGKEFISVPDNIGLLGKFSFKGKFTGFYNDFVAYGNFDTELGSLRSDMNFKYDLKSGKTSYGGHVESNRFQLGKFLGQDPLLGFVSLNADLKGSGLSKNELKANLKGKVNEFFFNNYNYRNATISGEISKGLFKGDLGIKDNNLDLGFSGTVDITKEDFIFDFVSDIRSAHLQKLNLINRDVSSELSARIEAHFSGSNIDNIAGDLILQNTVYSEKGKKYNLSNLYLSAASGDERSFYLKSDYADAYVKGSFNIASAISSVERYFSDFLPSFLPKARNNRYSRDNFDFEIKLKNTQPLTSLFYPILHIRPNASVLGNFNSREHSLDLKASFPSIVYQNRDYQNIYLESKENNGILDIRTHCQNLKINDSTNVKEILLVLAASDDSLKVKLDINNHVTEQNRAAIEGVFNFLSEKKFNFYFLPSQIFIQNDLWRFEKSEISFNTQRIGVSNFRISNGKQSFDIDGIIANNSDERLRIGFSNFDLSILDQLKVSKFNGIINGEAFLSGIYGDLRFSSNLSVSNLAVNTDTLGNATIISTWDNQSKIIGLVASLKKGAVKTVDLNGFYDTKRESNNLNFNLHIQKFYISFINRYLKEYISNLYGVASGDLSIKGTFEEPLIAGKLRLQKTSFNFNYLGTQYNFSDEFEISENGVYFKDVVLNDINGKTAKCSGRIRHNNFRDWKFDLQVFPDNFQSLNTNYYQNNLFYGTAYTTGAVYIRGTTDLLNLMVDLRSEKGTKIFIPLSNAEEISKGDFISFVSKDTSHVKNTSHVDLSGIKMDMDFEVTPDAEIQLLFDEKIGDKIRVKGSGNIKMDISTSGDFTMFGDYVIDEGDYLFTLQNIINKKFIVERGGTIRWTGVPYDANINLNAVYQTNASLFDLTQEPNHKYRVPVFSKLNLTGKLMNPTIKFDVNIGKQDGYATNMDDYTASLVKKYLYSDQEKANQVFSLLVLGRFKTPTELANNTDATSTNGLNTGIGANTSELLSNQLSNWASQLSDDINISVNYKARDNVSREQLEVALSKQLFNDRLSLDGNFGVAGNNPTQPNATNIVGDFNAEWKIFKDGKLRLKTFNRTNTSYIINANSPYTQGVGIFYREEYNSLKELIDKYKSKKK